LESTVSELSLQGSTVMTPTAQNIES